MKLYSSQRHAWLMRPRTVPFVARRAVTVIAAAAVVAALLALPSTAAAHDGGFSDVPAGGVHSADIDTLHDRGVLEGTLCSEEEFCPRAPLTRAHMAVWMVRIVDGAEPAPVTETRFDDVDGDHRHAAFIERLRRAEHHLRLRNRRRCATAPTNRCRAERRWRRSSRERSRLPAAELGRVR